MVLLIALGVLGSSSLAVAETGKWVNRTDVFTTASANPATCRALPAMDFTALQSTENQSATLQLKPGSAYSEFMEVSRDSAAKTVVDKVNFHSDTSGAVYAVTLTSKSVGNHQRTGTYTYSLPQGGTCTGTFVGKRAAS